MKLLAIIMLLGLTACSTNPKEKERERIEADRARQILYVQNAINQAPPWMSNTPQTGNDIYGVGTAVNSDWNVADYTAKAIAYTKICMTLGGIAGQRTQINHTETANKTTELSEMSLTTKCKAVDLTGIEIVDIKHIPEGPRFRTFVLVVLPVDNIEKFSQRQGFTR